MLNCTENLIVNDHVGNPNKLVRFVFWMFGMQSIDCLLSRLLLSDDKVLREPLSVGSASAEDIVRFYDEGDALLYDLNVNGWADLVVGFHDFSNDEFHKDHVG